MAEHSPDREELTPFANKLRETFRDIRRGGGVTQETVAEALSIAEGGIVKQSYVSKFEGGDCNVSQERWLHLAGALGISVEELHFEAIFHGVELSPAAAEKVAEVRRLIKRQFKIQKDPA
jgi:transcriptional regulator with XRE-family HTH domain